jgi:quinol monooxygenase YgiN
MYGTVAKFRVKPGALAEFKNQIDERRDADGFHFVYVFQSDNDENELWMVAIFEDKKSYFDNANSSDENAEFLRLRKLMTSEPVWHDGEIIFAQNEEGVLE